MSREQIEEMAVENLVAFLWYNTKMYDEDLIFDVAEALVNAGYRKQSEGEWFLLDECYNEGVYCSVCHKKVYRKEYANQKLKSNFCPNCGAKMKGGEG